jgi:hypothetical protein
MKISVQVQSDYLERISKVRKPIIAVAELIWNGVDADATEVRVEYDHNALGALERIRVIDNGSGLGRDEAEPAFANLGGSRKRAQNRSKDKRRLLHGKAGKGRFRAFSLGASVFWNTTFSSNGNNARYMISGSRAELGTFEIAEPELSTKATGTEVVIEGIEKNFPSLEGDAAVQEITQHFALYLRQYPDVVIWYAGSKIEPGPIEELVSTYPLRQFTSQDGESVQSELTIIEWKIPTERSLLLCDSAGFALAEMPPGIQAPRFDFTAYLKSDFLRELDEQEALVLEDLHPDLHKLLESSKDTLREHFRKRGAEVAANVVEQWKKEKLYPFEGEADDIIEETERQVFDVLALNINTYLPDFERADPKNKKLALQLLKQALEKDPTALQAILEDVLNLPHEKQEELAALLKKTTLSAIINASKVVADRLNFLAGLEMLIFEPESKKALLERRQLHRILANETWIFGEEFNLTVDDKSLDDVLARHLAALGQRSDDGEAVTREDGRIGIVDLMLSRVVPQPKSEDREHLVIELKRPAKKIDSDVASQIESYAFAVAEDERFKDTKTKWVFWVISNEMTDTVRRKARQKNRPEGILFEDEENRITVWARTWGQIIESARSRLQFFKEKLEYSADHDSGLEYLRKTHEKYLPKTAVFETGGDGARGTAKTQRERLGSSETRSLRTPAQG